jgi:6-phosphogluconolactonase
MGADGHTASLFPGSKVGVNSPTLAVTADYEGRPAERVTLTPPVINSARKVMFLITGEDKAETLSLVLSKESMPERLPAQRIQPTTGELIWLVDEAAGRNL